MKEYRGKIPQGDKPLKVVEILPFCFYDDNHNLPFLLGRPLTLRGNRGGLHDALEDGSNFWTSRSQ